MKAFVLTGGIFGLISAIVVAGPATQPAVPAKTTPVSGPPAGAGTPPAGPTGTHPSAGKVPATLPGGARRADGPVYVITRFIPRYLRDHPKLPPLKQVLDTRVELSKASDGYVAPRAGLPTVTLSLKELSAKGATPTRYHASAIQKILERVRDRFVAEHYMGVFVAPDPFEINESGKDVRPPGQTDLHIVITVGMVTDLRTLASGERIDPDKRVNNPEHARIRRQSPIQPYRKGQTDRQDLLRKDLLDDYAFWLSRQPGRRADVALSPGLEPGSVSVDYLITENKPWSVYAQGSNTGTQETSRWRERFGFFDNQLTGNDDVLSIDYTTAGFEKTNDVAISYEAPIGDSRWFRWRVSGDWSEFTASDVGFGKDTFTGQDWSGGAELISTVFQDRDLFVDLLVGGRYDHTEVNNTTPGAERGTAGFVLPHAGVRLDQAAEWFTNHAAVTVEGTDGGFTGASQSEVNNLGRGSVDRSWVTLNWDLSHSVYLEPLFDHEAWSDPGSSHATLAHELYLGFRGQYAFDSRLTPHAEQTVGGFYSVRGYEESAVAGDTVLIGTAEYRYHVPRGFGIQAESGKVFGQPFRWAPQYPYGTPDWDLILRAFVDAGRAINSDGDQFQEHDATLVGAGLGVELIVKRNVDLRADWGVALHDVPDRDIRAGSNRFHLVFTILY